MIDGSVLQSAQRCFEKKSRVVVKMVVNTRLHNFLRSRNLLHPSQIGFPEGFRTTDHIFPLRTKTESQIFCHCVLKYDVSENRKSNFVSLRFGVCYQKTEKAIQIRDERVYFLLIF